MITRKKLSENGVLRKMKKRINDLTDEVKALRICNGDGYKVQRTALGQLLSIAKVEKGAAPRPGNVIRLIVDVIENDILKCRRVDNNSEGTGEQFDVLRPLGLEHQAGLATGQTATVVSPQQRSFPLEITDANGNPGTITATQSVQPPYQLGKFIWATEDFEYYPSASPGYDWLDLNLDARSWRYDLKRFAVCTKINGVDTVQWGYLQGTNPITITP